ncbi:MAG: serine/threonine protein kinase, partial [Myxococcales bacterium]|nr:serine/threonine protein kinase [Myxococcales bacterium]
MPEATSTAPPPVPRPTTWPLFGSPTPSRPFGLGRLKGTPYVLESILGAGGMAGVYRARHLGLDRHVALKVLHPDGANDIAALEWLHREARLLARLKHPGVLQVHDLGISDDGRPFVALEYVDGPDLQTLVDDEAPLSAARAVRLIATCCEALAAVHAAGIVHRDVKPENIALVDAWTRDERTMLLDFGIAIGPDDPPLTGEGMTVGTPGFVAPEQAMGEAVDGRADQYGLAMVLYQLLTGRHPYRKGDVLETLEAQLSKPVKPPAELRPGLVSETLSGVVLRALALDPEDRYPDMQAFRA